MKPSFYFIAFFLCLFVTPAFSQAPVEQWVARYDSGGTDQLYDMTVDASGNVYVTGASVQVPFTADYLTIKYNSSGVKQWESVYEGIAGSDDRAYAIAVDAPGNVYITGGTGYDNSIVTVKYNSLGDSLWARSYRGPNSGSHNWTFAKSIFVDDSGYVYIAGSSEGLVGIHGLFQDYTTIKYSPLGVQQWVARHNGPGTDDDVINSMTVDGSGNVYVTGYAGGGSTGSADSYDDITTIKYNSLGSIVWSTTYSGAGTSSDWGNMLTIDNLGNVYITGYTFTDTSAKRDMITIKYNSVGTEQWKKSFNGPDSDYDEGTALAVDAEHSVYVTGKSDYGTSNGFDIVTVKYDSLGAQIWAKNLNGSANGNDVAGDITLDNDGNIYVLGTSDNTTTAKDFQLIKYDPAGTQLWEKKYTNGGSAGSQDHAEALFVDDANNIYVAGMSALDYAVVKYAQPTAIDETTGDITNVILYPNPATNQLNINLSGLQAEQVRIYNTDGKLVSDTKQPLNNRVDISNLAMGVYVAEIKVREAVQRVRWVKM